jgi:hypothetical protein
MERQNLIFKSSSRDFPKDRNLQLILIVSRGKRGVCVGYSDLQISYGDPVGLWKFILNRLIARSAHLPANAGIKMKSQSRRGGGAGTGQPDGYRLDSQVQCTAVSIHQQELFVLRGAHGALEIGRIRDGFAVDFLNHIAAAEARFGRLARRTYIGHHNTFGIGRQFERLGCVGVEVLNRYARDR